MPLSDHYPEMKGWTPVDKINSQALPQIPTPEVQVSPFLRTVLPLPLQYSGDTIKQYNRPGLSSFRIAPLPPGGIPAVNSAAISANTQAISTAVAGSVVDISLAMPPQYSVSGSPSSSVGNFVVGWLNEPSNFFLAGPTGITLYGEGAAVTTGSSTAASVSISSSNVNDFAMNFIATDALIGSSYNPGAGWSLVSASGGSQYGYAQTFATPSAITAAGAISPSQTWSSLLILFNSTGAASVLHTQVLNSGSFNSGTAAITAPTNGNTLLVVMQSGFLQGTGVKTITSVSDTQNNTWFPIASIGNTSGDGSAVSAWFAPNVTGGATTVSFTLSGSMSGNVTCFELTNIISRPGPPIFRQIFGTDLPFPSQSQKGAVFSLASSPHFFVTGLGTNGQLTTAQPSASDLTNGTTGSGGPVVLGTAPSINGVLFPRNEITLANGANNNVNPGQQTFVKIFGPSAAFNITGFQNGADGRVLYLYNSTSQPMTISNSNAGSSASNQILTLTGADVTLRTGQSFATFIYDGGQSLWILTSTN